MAVVPNAEVDEGECPPPTPSPSPTPPPPYNFSQVEISYSVQNDWNCNGLLDECEITSGTVFDCNNNGVPDEYDLFFEVASQAVYQDNCVDAQSIVHNVDYHGIFDGSTPDGLSSCDDIFTDSSVQLSGSRAACAR